LRVWLLQCVIAYFVLEGIRTLSLGTTDVHEFNK
jgi:hypothetical protein